ncbi:hypothetical protein QQ045_006524 [Rhodiola kirilowii]
MRRLSLFLSLARLAEVSMVLMAPSLVGPDFRIVMEVSVLMGSLKFWTDEFGETGVIYGWICSGDVLYLVGVAKDLLRVEIVGWV